jgi:ABC-type sugar transport system ATPase subunit
MTESAQETRSGIEIRGLRKSYGDTRALAGLDLTIRPGEVLGIAGPNGAGKSTLVRILGGEEVADEGEIVFAGEPLTKAAAARSVAVVHQEPQLFPNLTVAQNLLVGLERGRIFRPRLGTHERALMDELRLTPAADRPLEWTSLATQQRTEIARALARDATVFLFDEPNSALTDQESQELFTELDALASRGRAVVLVSHRLSDLVRHTGRVAIIRDGRCTSLLEGVHLTQQAIAHELVVTESDESRTGQVESPSTRAIARAKSENHELLRLSGWSHAGDAFRSVELEVEEGEIVALMGVEGAGGRELLRSIGGLEKSRGRIEIAGVTGRAAMRRATAFVPATRQVSLFSNLSVGENIVVRLDRDIATGLVLHKRRMRRLAREAVQRFLIKAASIAQSIRSLSGGNQQKVAIAAALARRPRAILLEEPTRGVDIGSRLEIYRLLRGFVEDGNAVVMFCTEVPEPFEVADRLYVLSDGRLSDPLLVHTYARVEKLAADVSKLERHSERAAAV